MLVYASSSAAFVQTIFQFLLLEKAGHVIKEILTVIYWYLSINGSRKYSRILYLIHQLLGIKRHIVT